MPRSFRKGIACHGSMQTPPFSQVSVVDLYNDESSFANCMTAISGVTHFDMDLGSACQELSEKV